MVLKKCAEGWIVKVSVSPHPKSTTLLQVSYASFQKHFMHE